VRDNRQQGEEKRRRTVELRCIKRKERRGIYKKMEKQEN
jgi:hypothetical protein